MTYTKPKNIIKELCCDPPSAEEFTRVTSQNTNSTQNDWEKDLETEKLITDKNQHSVLHSCPTHGTGCYVPLENKCPDCKLYLSGKDVRQLLTNARKEVIDKIKQWAIKNLGGANFEEIDGLNELLDVLATLREE